MQTCYSFIYGNYYRSVTCYFIMLIIPQFVCERLNFFYLCNVWDHLCCTLASPARGPAVTVSFLAFDSITSAKRNITLQRGVVEHACMGPYGLQHEWKLCKIMCTLHLKHCGLAHTLTGVMSENYILHIIEIIVHAVYMY